MLTSEKTRRLKLVGMLLVLGALGFSAANFYTYSKAKNGAYKWTNDQDDSVLVYKPKTGQITLVLNKHFSGEPKVYKPQFEPVPSKKWNTLLLDRYMKLPATADEAAAKASLDDLSQCQGTLELIALRPPHPLRLQAIRQIAYLAQRRSDKDARAALTEFLKEGGNPRILMIRAIAAENDKQFNTDDEYEQWFSKAAESVSH